MRNSYRILLCLVAWLGANLTGWAQQVSVNEALDVARGYMTGTHGFRVKSKADPQLAYTAKKNGNVCYYVFNNGNDGGFVIVGGDERARQVLGIVPEGSFKYDELPCNFKEWIDGCEQQIDYAIRTLPEVNKADKEQRQVRRAAGRAAKASIPDLVTTKWNQNDPYNRAIIAQNGNHNGNRYGQPYVTGCVATAMAQVMKHHNYPTHGIGAWGYTNPVDYNPFFANFEQTTYDWANMKDVYTYGNYTDEEANAVATLMFHCGVASEMEYNDNESGTTDIKAAKGLRQYFGYSNSTCVVDRKRFLDEDWENMLYNELSAGRPVMYAGSSMGGGGHCFVCHGYSASLDMYSFNWGWGGHSDGYFAITGTDALWPSALGIGGGSGGSGFILHQAMTIGIKPAGTPVEEDDAYPLYIHNTQPYEIRQNGYGISTVTDIDLSEGDQDFTMKVWLYNPMDGNKTVDLGVMLQDDITGECYYTNALETRNFLADHYIQAISLPFSTDLIPNSSMYSVYPVIRPAGGTDNDWVKTPFNDIEIDNFYKFRVIGRGVQHTIPLEITLVEGPYISYPEDYEGNITVTSSDNDIISVGWTGTGSTSLNIGSKSGTAEIIVEAEAYGIYEATTKTFTYTNKTYSTYHFGSDFYVDDITAPNAEDVINNITDYRTGVKSTMTTNGGKVTYTIRNDTWNPIPAQDIHIVIENQGNVWNEEYQGWDYVSQIYVETYRDVEWDAYESKKFTIDLTSMAPLLESRDGNSNLSITPCLGYSMESWGVNYSEVIGGLRLSATVVPTLEIPYTLSAAGWGTLCLPYESEIPDGLEVYTCDGVSNKTLLLTRVRKLEANTPYITSGTPGNYNFYGVQVDENNLQDTYSRGFLTGVLKSGVQIPSNAYLLQKKNDVVGFYRYVGAAANATPYRAFLNGNRLDGRYSSFYFPGMDMGNNEATGIETTRPAQSTMPAGIYDMQGRRIEQLQKGINILRMEDGSVKKVLVK